MSRSRSTASDLAYLMQRTFASHRLSLKRPIAELKFTAIFFPGFEAHPCPTK